MTPEQTDELARAAEAEAEGERRHRERRLRHPVGPWLGERRQGDRRHAAATWAGNTRGPEGPEEDACEH